MASEVEQIFKHIESKQNFLLSGGAGSGKTFTLIETIKKIKESNPLAKIACITYTNVAVNQIRQRAPYEKLYVSTIHDFLWDNISSFQKNLKMCLVELIDSDQIRYNGEENLDFDYFNSEDRSIQYKEWLKLSDGVISHDHVILISEKLFEKYKVICDIIKDKFDFILIDEYQDTFEPIVKILLTHLKKSNKNLIIGFFGDSMQSIYSDNRVGGIQAFVKSGEVAEIVKEENRRNGKNIINLINKIRSDGLIQKPAKDKKAPNFQVNGSIKLLYSNKEKYDISKIKKLKYFKDFDFSDNKKTKELYLVHNLIASKVGFPKLMAIYDKDYIIDYKNRVRKEIKSKKLVVDESKTFGEIIEIVGKEPTPTQKRFITDNPGLYNAAKSISYSEFRKLYPNKDQLIGDKKNLEAIIRNRGQKRDTLIKHLFDIQECIYLYQEKKYNEFIRKTQFSISSHSAKIELKENIDELSAMSNSTIECVINYAHENSIWCIDDRLENFKKEKSYTYNRVKDVKYGEIISLYNYIEDFTPFSTQHNIKGDEFDDVFVILDNGNWTSYNFDYLFSNTANKESIIERTKKLFYVCCSRAKNNLVVYFNNPNSESIRTAEEWFGSENVHLIEA